MVVILPSILTIPPSQVAAQIILFSSASKLVMKLDFKLKERYEFNYKNYFVSIDVLTNKIIQVSAKHNTDYENNFNHQFIYYKKKEAIKAIKEKIDNLIN